LQKTICYKKFQVSCWRRSHVGQECDRDSRIREVLYAFLFFVVFSSKRFVTESRTIVITTFFIPLISQTHPDYSRGCRRRQCGGWLLDLAGIETLESSLSPKAQSPSRRISHRTLKAVEAGNNIPTMLIHVNGCHSVSFYRAMGCMAGIMEAFEEHY
jgi:hypothetical protein